MKKKHFIASALLVAFAIAGQMQAWYWMSIENKTPWNISVWGKWHQTYSDKANAKKILKGQRYTFWVQGDVLKNNEVYILPDMGIQREGGLESGSFAAGRQYYDVFHTELNFDIHKQKTAQVVRRYILEPTSDGVGLRMKEYLTAKERWTFGMKPEAWFTLPRTRVFITGTGQEVE